MNKKKYFFYRKILTLVLSFAVLLVLLLVVSVYQNRVIFEDSGLEAAILEKLNKPNGPVLHAELAGITHLDASGWNISSLNGIERLYRLEVLNVADNKVEDLAPLKDLNNLIDLNLRNNGITNLELVNISALSGLSLRRLNLRHNVIRYENGKQIRLSDIEPLSDFTALVYLSLRDNHIADISPLARLINLQTLDIRENRISDIKSLEDLTSLRSLNLRGNDIEDFSPISALVNLNYLNIHSNSKADSLGVLKNLIRLQTLIMANVPLGNQISVLRNMTDLNRLNIRNSEITGISDLVNLMTDGTLQDDPAENGEKATLDIRYNQIEWSSLQAYKEWQKYWFNITNRRPFYVPALNQVDPPIFSHNSGFYNEPFELTITHSDPEAIIIYTLDGSEPDLATVDSGSAYRQTYIYKHPIHLKSRKGEPNLFSEIKTTGYVYDWLPEWTEPLGEVFKASVVRAKAVKPNTISNYIHTATYFIDNEIEFRYADLPVISLVGDYRDLFDPATGIYVPGVNPESITDQNFFEDWRRPAHIQFFDLNRTDGFRGYYEIRVQGHTSRSSPQKGLHVIACSELGDSLIHYTLFSNRQGRASDISHFKRFILRAWGSARIWPVIFADSYHQMLVHNKDLDVQSYRPVIVFINGEYWGLHELREANKNSWYYQFHYGIDRNDPGIDIFYSEAGEANEGVSDHRNQLWSFVRANDMADDKNFSEVTGMMDIQNFIEYIIHSTFTGKRDWPQQNEAKWRIRKSNDKWRWIQFDMDQGISDWSAPEYSMIEAVMVTNPHKLLVELMNNQQFKRRFINTYADWMNTVFTTHAEMDLFNTMAGELAPYIDEFVHRWPFDQEHSWESGLAYGRNLINRRRELRLEQLKSFFQLSDVILTLDMLNSNQGHIRVNTINISDSSPGVKDKAYPWTGNYFIGIPIELKAYPKDGYRFAGWKIKDDENLESNVFLRDPFITLDLSSDTMIEAVFDKSISHYTP